MAYGSYKEENWFQRKWRELEFGEVVLFGVLGVCGAIAVGGVALVVMAVADDIKNPVYKYAEEVTDTVYDVTPTKDRVLHRITDTFGEVADFKKGELCDVEIGVEEIVIPSSVKVGSVSVDTSSTAEVEALHPYNCRAFNDIAANSPDVAVLDKMQPYLERAKQDHAAKR